jgi:hypothetical protein
VHLGPDTVDRLEDWTRHDGRFQQQTADRQQIKVDISWTLDIRQQISDSGQQVADKSKQSIYTPNRPPSLGHVYKPVRVPPMPILVSVQFHGLVVSQWVTRRGEQRSHDEAFERGADNTYKH